MADGIRKHVSGVPIYWGTDLEDRPIEQYKKLFGLGVTTIFSGSGEWSDRLRQLLDKYIPTDYVLYMQEDHWPISAPPDLNSMMNIVHNHGLLRLQLSKTNHFYRVTQQDELLFFEPDSKYLVSHQPSIWKKDFLIECLLPSESPWRNEYAGTIRLNNRKDIERKIAIYPCDWYRHMCEKGVVVES